MISGVRTTATVQPGGLIEIRSDELTEGATVEVLILIETAQTEETKPIEKTTTEAIEPIEAKSNTFASFFGAAKGSFASAAEIDEYIRQERDSWDS